MCAASSFGIELRGCCAIGVLGFAMLAFSTASTATPLSNCRGDACGDLDITECVIRNTGTRPIELFVKMKGGGLAGIGLDDPPLPPGGTKDLEGRCPLLQMPEGFVARHVTEARPGEVLVKPEDVFGMRKVSCDGEACGHVSLEDFGGCVWLQSQSDRPVTATVTIGTETLTLALEGANAEKAAASEEASKCAQTPNADVLRAMGVQVSPEFEERHRACKALATAEQAQRASGARVTGHHTSIYVALTGGKQAVFRAELMRASGCVKKVGDIAAYTANYGAPETTAKPADKPSATAKPIQEPACKVAVSAPCAGDACRAICAEDSGPGACREGLRNGSDRAIEIAIHFKASTLSRIGQPGEFFSLGTPFGCASLADISRIEANYR